MSFPNRIKQSLQARLNVFARSEGQQSPQQSKGPSEKKLFGRWGLLLLSGLVAILILAGGWAAQAAPATQVGSGTPASCTEAAFNTALNTLQVGGGGMLSFNCGGAATIQFTSQKTIYTSVVIDGEGFITLSGGNTTRHFLVSAAGGLTLRNILLVDGNSGSDYGGSIYNNGGTLTLQGSTIRSAGTAGWSGGAIIDFAGLVTLEDSLIELNESSYGAINSTGTLTLVRTVVRGNTASTGGGGLSVGGFVTIQDSVFEYNRAARGGAVYITQSAEVHISGSTFTGNQADAPVATESHGGAILNYGELYLERSIFQANQSLGFGGAILSGPASNDAFLTIKESTFTANQAFERGGAIDNRRGALTIVNSTISGNLAASGGGIVNFLGPANLYYTTIGYNAGGNLEQTALEGYVDNFRQRISISRSVLTGGANCAINGVPGPLPHFVSNQYNLSDDFTCDFFLTQTGDSNNTEPLLGPLADNGGLTYTHLPQEDSPLVDAAACSFDFLSDQRRIGRPQGGLCDIGAVELAPPGVQPTPLPSPTPRPSPTPAPTPTVPAPGAVFPAPALIRAGGLRPSIQLSTTHAYGGQPVTISGQGVPGYDQVRVFSMERGQTVGAATAQVNPQGNYQIVLNVPAAAALGPTQVCAMAAGLADAELECTPFTIDPMPAGSLSGQVQSPDVASWNAQLNLLDTRGRLAQVVPIDANGNFALDNLYPGKYKAAVTGQTSGNVDAFEVAIYPQENTVINPLQNVSPCLPGDGDGLVMLSRLFGAQPAAFDPYDNAVIAELHPLTIDTIKLQLNKTTFQREYFGYYVSGVFREETFKVFPQLFSEPDAVIFRLYNADDTLVEASQPDPTSPYEATFDVGKIKPSSISLGDPYLVAALIKDGKEEDCPTHVKIRVIADPMKDTRLRQNGSQTWWDQKANVYRFKGVIPNIPGLPFDFKIPPPPVPELPFFERFDNRLDAGIYFHGILTEDGLVQVHAMDARAEVKLLNAVIISPTQYKMLDLSAAEKSLLDWKNFRIQIPEFSLLPKSPIEVGVPFVASPALSLFGLIEITVGSSAKGAFDLTLQGSVAPFQPDATAILTPWGSAEAELTVGAGIGSGLVSTGAGPGFRLKVSTPLTAKLFPSPNLSVQVCPEITVFLHVYAQAAWGLASKHHYEDLASINDCFPLAPARAEELGAPSPGVFAAPAVASATDGRVLTAYVENTGSAESPQVQIIVNLLDSGGGLIQAAHAVSDPTHSATNPVVTFVGPGHLPLVAWVEKPYDAAMAAVLGSDLNAHITRQEIFYSLYQAGQWSVPQRLTNDLLADGMPSLAGDSTGAVLAWVRDLDGNFGTRSDQRIAASLFDLNTLSFGSFELLSPALSGLNGDVRAAYRLQTPYLAWIFDADASLPTADDRRLVFARRNTGSWLLDVPANLPSRVDSPAISVDNLGVSLAFLVREANPDGQVGLLGTNGILWTARQDQGAWNAAPLRGSEGEFVYGEQPSLASMFGETLLAFRRFGDSSTFAGLGQISLSQMQPDGQFSPPIYTTNEDNQNWQPALTINPLTMEAVVIKVSRAAWKPASSLALAPGGASARTPISSSQAELSAAALTGANTTLLSAAEDPVGLVSIVQTADPALDWMQPSVPSAPADTQIQVAVQLRNAGRDPISYLDVSLYAGIPGAGTLLDLKTVYDVLSFNQSLPVTFTITTTPGIQLLYAQVSTYGENLSPLNDIVTLTLGQLTPPVMEAVLPSSFTPNALEVTWYPVADESAASYRVLRASSPDGPFEVIGETRFARFTDTLVALGQSYCYSVQSYNGGGNISEISIPVCGSLASGWKVYLPAVMLQIPGQ